MSQSDYIAKGSASFTIPKVDTPRDFDFVLLPKLTMLALSAAIEPLRVANQISQQELYRWRTMTTDGAPIRCSNNLQLVPDGPIANAARGTRVFVCAGVEPSETMNARLVQWTARQAAHGVAVGAICTGAFTLAKAGLLRGRTFTLHWENQPAFLETFPDLLPSPNLFEIDGDLMTAAGGSASTDLMLNVIEDDFGPEFALVVSDMCLHGRSHSEHAPQKTAQSAILGSRNKNLIAAIRIMQTHLEEPLTVERIAKEIGISRRQLERSFAEHARQSPRQYYADLRLSRGYALLSETDLPISEIAAATGFGDTSAFARVFRGKFDISPSKFRKRW
ncbi:GlxA family transcriptional regulator [Roseovarius pelagicus]|uniref:GlxA family transcriptional regulator n=1 Tax=Roseovarius pelagicus TaxID=2980108 RepID=A0ABY6DB12_9RHOB|nr:GlxA family transcriptional regulator [Roseovarius pelagicus]UXX83302.1 GlxA family transcriptional regulator [Roseovarius pelagicus]